MGCDLKTILDVYSAGVNGQAIMVIACLLPDVSAAF